MISLKRIASSLLLRRSRFEQGRPVLRQLCQSVDQFKLVVKKNPPPHEASENVLQRIFEKAAETDQYDDMDWDTSMDVIKRTEEVLPPLKPTPEQLRQIRASRPTATFSSIINQSDTLKKLVDLGVELYLWEKRNHLDLAVKLDFERDVAPYIKFLADLGIPHDMIGSVLTRGPLVLEVAEDDLKTRIMYLASKKFSPEDIARIVQAAPHWLTHSVKGIDSRLGFLQKTFHLTGDETRYLATECSSLVIKKDLVPSTQRKLFSIKEEMGFSQDEIKEIILQDPIMFLKHSPRSNQYILSQFDLLHTQLGIPQSLLCKFPRSIRRSSVLTLSRHKFLQHLGKAQYKPDQPGYVSLEMLTEGTEEEFCDNVARCNVDLFYKFLKTI